MGLLTTGHLCHSIYDEIPSDGWQSYAIALSVIPTHTHTNSHVDDSVTHIFGVWSDYLKKYNKQNTL